MLGLEWKWLVGCKPPVLMDSINSVVMNVICLCCNLWKSNMIDNFLIFFKTTFGLEMVSWLRAGRLDGFIQTSQ